MPAFPPEPSPTHRTRCCQHTLVYKKSHLILFGPSLLDITVLQLSVFRFNMRRVSGLSTHKQSAWNLTPVTPAQPSTNTRTWPNIKCPICAVDPIKSLKLCCYSTLRNVEFQKGGAGGTLAPPCSKNYRTQYLMLSLCCRSRHVPRFVLLLNPRNLYLKWVVLVVLPLPLTARFSKWFFFGLCYSAQIVGLGGIDSTNWALNIGPGPGICVAVVGAGVEVCSLRASGIALIDCRLFMRAFQTMLLFKNMFTQT